MSAPNFDIQPKIASLEVGVRTILKWITIAVVFLMVGVINLQIFFRYVLGNALPWPEGFAVLLNIWLTYLGGAIAYYEGDHVSVGYLHKKMPRKLARIVTVFTNMVIIVLAAAMVYFGSQLAISQADGETIYLGISLFWSRIPLAIGGFYLLIEASRRISDAITDSDEGDA